MPATAKYQPESCPRCGTGFICKPNNIGSCGCSRIHVSNEEQAYISSKFLTCLCNTCLMQLKYDYYLEHHHNKPMKDEPEI